MWNWIKEKEGQPQPFFQSLIGCHNSFTDDYSSDGGQFRKFSRSSRTVFNDGTQQSLAPIDEGQKGVENIEDYAYKKGGKESSERHQKKSLNKQLRHKVDSFTFAENVLLEGQQTQGNAQSIVISERPDADSSAFQSYLKEQQQVESTRQPRIVASAGQPVQERKSLAISLANKIKMHRNNEQLRLSRVTPIQPQINLRSSNAFLNPIPQEPEKKMSQKQEQNKIIKKYNESQKKPGERMSLVDLIKSRKLKKDQEIPSKPKSQVPSKHKRQLTPQLAAILTQFQLQPSQSNEQMPQPPSKKAAQSKSKIPQLKPSQKANEVEAAQPIKKPQSILPARLMERLLLHNDDSRKPSMILKRSFVSPIFEPKFEPKQPPNFKAQKPDNNSFTWIRQEQQTHTKQFMEKYSTIADRQISLQLNRVRIDNIRRILEEYKKEMETVQVASQVPE